METAKFQMTNLLQRMPDDDKRQRTVGTNTIAPPTALKEETAKNATNTLLHRGFQTAGTSSHLPGRQGYRSVNRNQPP